MMNKKAQIGLFGLELSPIGVGGAVFGLLFVFLLRNQMLYPFLQYMPTWQKYFFGVATYVCVAIAGYMISNKLLGGE